MSHEGFWQSIFKHGLKSKYLKNIIPYGNSLVNAVTGAHLTGAQQEANTFEAEQAQKQMDFQQQMSNTQYQRGVADMQAAGVNPALVYGAGHSGASTPSGAMAASESPGSPDVVGLLGQIANLKLLGAQKRNLEAQTGKTLAETDLTKQNVVKAGAEINQISANVRKLGLDADAQEIVNKYLDRIQNVTLQNMTLTGDKLAAEWTEIQQKIANLKAEESATLQNIVESRQRVNNLLLQGQLTTEQINEVKSTVARIDQETANLIKNGVLTQKDIDFYEWNHGEAITLPYGAKLGARSFNRVDKSKR